MDCRVKPGNDSEGVVPAKAGPMITAGGYGSRLSLCSAGTTIAWSGRSTNQQLWEMVAGDVPLFPDCYLQWMAQLQRVEPSVRRGFRWWWLTRSGVANPTYDIGRRRVLANEVWRQDGGYNSPRRQRAKSESALAAQPASCSGHKKIPRRVCPAGGRQLNLLREHQGTMSRWTRMRRP
jgi:hypothetical protein